MGSIRTTAPATSSVAASCGVPTSFGQASYVHVDIGDAANIPAVAADLRNVGATVIIACCSTHSQAVKLGAALCMAAFGTVTRGDGGKGRAGSDEYQESYHYAFAGNVVVGGRRGIVQSLTHKLRMSTPLKGQMFIADVDFKVGIQESLNIRVAAIMVNSTVVESGEGSKDWQSIVQK